MYIQVIQVILERAEMGDKNGIQFGEVEADTTYFHKKKILTTVTPKKCISQERK